MQFIRQVTARNNRFVLGISLLAALGGFLFGYDTGVVGGALPLITHRLHLSSNQESWVTGSLLLGAVSGAALSGFLADRIGRRWTIFAAGVIYTAAALASGFMNSMLTLGIARGVLGLAVGTASFVAPMYIGEHSPKQLRGGMTAMTQLSVTLGIFIAYLVDDAFKTMNGGWRWMFALGAAPGLILAIAMLFVPESPRWLIEHGREDDARNVLERANSGSDVDAELAEMQKVSRQQQRFALGELVGARIRPLLVIGVVMAVMQQLIGINTVIYYGATILGYAGFSTNSSIAQAVFIGLVNLVGAGIAVLLLDRVGRRVPLLVGTAGSVIGLVVLGLYFAASSHFQHAHAWIALVAMMFYIASFEISLGPIFWVMIAEIFPLKARAKAMAICTMFNWAFNFLVSFFFLDAVKLLGESGTFFLYAGFGIIAIAFFAWRVPETKDRSLEQIESDVHGEPQLNSQRRREERNARRERAGAHRRQPLSH